MEKSDKLRTLITSLCDGNASEFARRLGVRQQTIPTWLSRNTLDYDKIAEAFPEVRAEWLLRGSGEPIRDTRHEASPQVEALTAELHALQAEVDVLRLRCSRLTDALLDSARGAREDSSGGGEVVM